MILKFYCSNFKSILSEIEFNMFAGNYKRHENHTIKYKNKSILRASVIYGLNGSGKTNLILALDTLHRLATRGTSSIDHIINIPKFKLNNTQDNPSKFELDYLIEGKRYNYSIEINNNVIINESLYEIKDNTELLIFKREKREKKILLTILPNKNKTQKEKLREEIYSEELRDNQPFFFEAYNKKISEVIIPFEWLKNNIHIINFESRYSGLASTFYNDKDFFNSAIQIIKEANIGISDIKLVEYSYDELKSFGFSLSPAYEKEIFINKKYIDINFKGELYSSFLRNNEVRFVKFSTIHKSIDDEDVEFKYFEESKGIQRLFELLPALHRSLHKGQIFIIDEIESSFHPVLIKEILELYLNSTPQKSGQIIFTTHECNLLDLDLLRQDEIWFCEKDRIGQTRLYSLSEFKPRFDKDIRKGYLEGQFGLIPFLNDVKQLEL